MKFVFLANGHGGWALHDPRARVHDWWIHVPDVNDYRARLAALLYAAQAQA